MRHRNNCRLCMRSHRRIIVVYAVASGRFAQNSSPAMFGHLEKPQIIGFNASCLLFIRIYGDLSGTNVGIRRWETRKVTINSHNAEYLVVNLR